MATKFYSSIAYFLLTFFTLFEVKFFDLSNQNKFFDIPNANVQIADTLLIALFLVILSSFS